MTIADFAQKHALRLAASLPLGLVRPLAGKPVTVDGQSLHPQVQFLLRLSGHGEDRPSTPEALRQEFDTQSAWLSPQPRRPVRLENHALAGARGPRTARLYVPEGVTAGGPALLYFHGGGHVAGSLTSHNDVCRSFADRIGCRVIAYDYRLAPEHPFPAGIDDGLAAFRDLVARAEAFGIDRTRIAVGGDSAGANVAAVIAQACRNDAQPPAFQMLLVPWLELGAKMPSYRLFGKGFFLEEVRLDWYTRHYLPDPAMAADPRASPLRGDVRGVCPAAIMVAAFDPLRDEGEAYGGMLTAAGVPVEVIRVPGVPHIFINVAGYVGPARAAFAQAAAIVRQALRV